MSINCKICGQVSTSRTVQVRSKKSLEIFHCENCDFDFFDFNPENLLIEDKLDQSRLKAAGLDIPSIEEDFKNGLKDKVLKAASEMEKSSKPSRVVKKKTK